MVPAPAAAPDREPATFAALGLSHAALAAVARAGFAGPTPIQALSIPPALAGRDVIGCAATGTGKTLAFALPMIDRLAGRPRSGGARALILAPTRELALQIAAEVERFGRARGFQATAVIGGVAMGPQIQELRRGHAIVATPGRLVDHLERGSVRLSDVELLVLDEADRMLDMGFAPQLRRILAALPPRERKARQTLLFSATMAGEVADFARSHLADPVRVSANPPGVAAPRAEQRVYLVPQGHKTALLLALLSEDSDSTLVFTRTKRRADRLARALEGGGHSVARIHADRSQSQRRQALQGFSRGTYRVLVATDIAARGIDVTDIRHVVNYDLPHVPEDYVHRIGRTARAEKSGRASTFASPDELGLLRGIERLTRKTVARAELPHGSPVFQAALAKAPEASEAPAGRPFRPDRRRARGSRRRAGAAGAGRNRPRSPGR